MPCDPDTKSDLQNSKSNGHKRITPCRRRVTTYGHCAERLIVEMQVDLGRIEALRFNDGGEVLAGILPSEYRM